MTTSEKLELETRKLELEDANFRVNSDGWVKKTSLDGQEFMESPTGDIWEIANCREYPELNNEQLFTWDAAIRETARAGKRIPSDQEFDKLLKTKNDMPNLVFAGYRNTAGSFLNLSSAGTFWSSVQSGSNAWRRYLHSGFGTVYRATYSKAYGFSVRCLKD
ncbi:MAG: hypothetical protein ABIJ84_00410 [bacterium]